MIRRRIPILPLLAIVLGGLFTGCGGGASSAPPPPSPWNVYAAQHCSPLSTLDMTTADTSDLAFLGPVLQGKTLVALGESGHGVAEFSQAKARLIKYLHEVQGFDVLVFESSILSCYQAQQEMASQPASKVLDDAIFQVWSTQDVLQLFQYVQSTQATANPLVLAGMDVQLTTRNEAATRPGIFQEVVGRIDPGYAQQVHDMDLAFCQAYFSTTPPAPTADQQAGYAALTAFLDAHMPDLVAAYPDRPAYPMVVRQAAWGMGPFLNELMVPLSSQACYEARDAGMAANLAVLTDTLYPGKKVMVWAHNAHLEHDGLAVTGRTPTWLNTGTLMEAKYGSSLYSLGLFMYQGYATYVDRTLYEIQPAPAGTLESVVHSAGQPFAFLDLAGAAQGDGTSWMFQPFGARDWGVTLLTYVPKDQFDGVLVIDTVHPPAYL
jgi:erythromycin esterase